MTRTASGDVQTAVSQKATTPPLLIYIAWDTPARYATWDTDIPWNSETWIASGIKADNLDSTGGTLVFPNDTDYSVSPNVDYWLDRIAEDPLDRVVEIYKYNINKTVSPEVADATKIFTGILDRAEVSPERIRVSLVESRQAKGFPPTSIEPPVYNWLLDVGDRLYWGTDVITVN